MSSSKSSLFFKRAEISSEPDNRYAITCLSAFDHFVTFDERCDGPIREIRRWQSMVNKA
jgi:hypothetical protein